MVAGSPRPDYDAVVVGAGPNGLAAAIEMAGAGRSVLVVEAAATVGGGTRTEELTVPGFRHDVCSAIHPMGAASPFFAGLPLDQHGLEWVHPDVALAHPLDDGTARFVHRSIDETAAQLGPGWRRVFGPLVHDWPVLAHDLLRPPAAIPSGPLAFARFGIRAAPPAALLGRAIGPPDARAVWSGIASHANTSLGRPLSAAAGSVLVAAGHAAGWPAARGGSQAIADALASHLRALGGTIECGQPIRSLDDLPRAKAVLFDTTPWQLVSIAGDRLPPGSYRRYRHGSATFKLDYALDGPMPWSAEGVGRAGTVHLGGSAEAITAAERDVATGHVPERPLVLVAQQSMFDDTRAPAGKHTLWAYCHVPVGCEEDMTARIEAQLERFAPGWRELVLGRAVHGPAELEAHNANYVGGDIAGGASDGLQLLFRPRIALDPYRTPAEGLYLCSASTPPGAGVHGMAGYWAARSALERL
ncbi:MAG TPA: NAD(P)/FAD-dependent oxidoreductase [Acidimicrobiales bacterium]